MCRLLCILAACGLCARVHASYFMDDFEDNDISDWIPSCGPTAWYAVGGQARASTGYSCSALLSPWTPESMDVLVSTSGTATHVFGLVARMSDPDTGIYAYVSPDYDVARIRLVSAGSTSTILNSLSADFPGYVDYELNLTCTGSQLYLEIIVPSTMQYWQLEAVDPSPVSGMCGLATGDELLASWNWFSAQTPGGVSEPGTGPVDAVGLSISPNPDDGPFLISLDGCAGIQGAFLIEDLSGRIVAEVPAVCSTDESISALWDGCSSGGRPAPAGMYRVICITSEGNLETGSLVLLR
ncbi:MAG: hypothetical protein QUS11_01510 [Candidatus Fermentibacter sp.]|nr:hypothetical protein [Candidatus Fermentibacter sp.]